MADGGNEIVSRNKLGTRLGHHDNRTHSIRDRLGNQVAEGGIAGGLIADERNAVSLPILWIVHPRHDRHLSTKCPRVSPVE